MRENLRVMVVVAMTVLLTAAGPCRAADGSGTISETVKGALGKELAEKGIEGLLVDDAAGSVSAASLAGVEADSVSAVDNVRDFSVLLKAFDSKNDGFGLSIAPARTRFPVPRINLSEYAKESGYHLRLLGGVTLSYAQGKTAISGNDYTRRAVALATNAYVHAADDPLVAVMNAKECTAAMWDKVPDDKPSTTAVQAEHEVLLRKLEAAAAANDTKAVAAIAEIRAKAAAGDKAALADIDSLELSALVRKEAGSDAAARAELKSRQEKSSREEGRVSEATTKAALEAFNTCADGVLKKHSQKWNRTRYAVSFGTGSVKRSDGAGSSVNLGRTLAVTLLYGFDGIKALQDSAAVAVTARRSSKEPVLDTLGTDSVQTKNSTLVSVRLSGGSSVFRGLIEANNAKDTDVTTTNRTLRRALGIDYRIMDGLWLNLRYGKQRKVDGTGNETSSFLLLNYSPSALLGH